jgi:cell wall assembly regulator SMI1
MYQPRSASLNHPPLDRTWDRIRTWLSNEYPELGDTLNYGILPDTLAEIELHLDVQLPRAVRESYLITDGQEAESSAGCSDGLFFGLSFLPLEDVLDEWRFWREVDEDPTTGANQPLLEAMQSIPAGWVRRVYSCRGWIPLITDKAGNYIGVDLSPPPRPDDGGSSPHAGGSVGQVIAFGRDFDTKIVLWRGDGESGWARWLASFAEELESGEGFEVRGSDQDKEGSDEDSEDSIGYDGYYSSGNGGTKGGDAGSAGSFRFTGEYKGWTAIEVWADRSYKRWHAAGLIPDEDIVGDVEPTHAATSSSDRPTAAMREESPPSLDITPADILSNPDDANHSSATPTTLIAPPTSDSLISTSTSTSSAAAPSSNASSTFSTTSTSQNTSLLPKSKIIPSPSPSTLASTSFSGVLSKSNSQDLLSFEVPPSKSFLDNSPVDTNAIRLVDDQNHEKVTRNTSQVDVVDAMVTSRSGGSETSLRGPTEASNERGTLPLTKRGVGGGE